MNGKTHLGVASLIVHDLEGAAAFYRDVMGFVDAARIQAQLGDREVEEIIFQATGDGAAHFGLIKFLDRDGPSFGEFMPGFYTSDILAVVGRAKAAGGSVVADVQVKADHGVKLALLKDPEGHVFEVVEMLAA